MFTDVDDTLTWHGKLPPQTFNAMVELQQHGIKLIPVTGASAGWCDCMVRTWPIDTIIGENGAFHIRRNSNGNYAYIHELPESERHHNWEKLTRLKQAVLEKFEQAKQTVDQSFRLNDIAFDINQEHHVTREIALNIAKFCISQGANAKISSIHINVWLGDYSKSTTATKWLNQQGYQTNQAVFIGDSPNDDDMFSKFETSIGVANIKPLLSELTTPPTYITLEPGGIGFAEFSRSLIKGARNYST